MSDVVTPSPAAAGSSALGRVEGRFFWYELLTTDLDAALDFYRRVVGWTSADSGMEGMRYELLQAGDRAIGGAMQLTPDMLDGGARPGWLGYVAVADTDAMAARIEAAGGRILMPPADIPDVGRFALVADPGGAAFYLLAPFPQDQAQPPPKPSDPGIFAWHELYAGNGEAQAFAFYSDLFGWETTELMEMGPMGKYRLVARGGEPFGGMMDRPPSMPASVWNYYVNVAGGIDAAVARIEAGGGQVTLPPQEVPGGSWVVQARDPQGGPFSLVSATR